MADRAKTPHDNPVERVRDHLGELDERHDEMQQRLDEVGEGIDQARRQAEDDELLPGDDGTTADRLDWPSGDESRETPVSDSDVPPAG